MTQTTTRKPRRMPRPRRRLARSELVTSAHMTRGIGLAFLDPAIVTRIVEGKTHAGIDAKRLTLTDAIPIGWNAQRRRLGFPSHR